MTRLTAEQHFTFIAEGRTSIALTVDAGSMASVAIRRPNSTGTQQKYYETSTVTGIYPADVVTITAESGSIEYEVTNLSATYSLDPTTGAVVGLVGPDGENAIRFATKDLQTPQFEKHGAPLFSSADSDYPRIFWWFVVSTENLSSPMGEYYAYYSTEHDATLGGISLAYADSPYGPWTNYGEVFVDTARTTSVGLGQTETPSVIYDSAIGGLRMFYQQKSATVTNRFTGAALNAQGSQSTLSATSLDGVSWSVDPTFIIDVLPAGASSGDGHCGYFLPFVVNNTLHAYSLYGSGNYPHGAIHHCIGNPGEWVTDPRPLTVGQPYCVLGDAVQRKIEWWQSFVFEWNGKPHLLATLSDFVSGGAASNRRIAVAPMSADLREPLGKFTQVWDITLSFETGDVLSMTPFVDGQTLYVYLVVRKSGVDYVEVLKNV